MSQQSPREGRYGPESLIEFPALRHAAGVIAKTREPLLRSGGRPMRTGPPAPGRGPPGNQPATVVVCGTWSVPFLFSPRWISVVFLIPIAGMLTQTGLATAWA